MWREQNLNMRLCTQLEGAFLRFDTTLSTQEYMF